MKTMLKIQIPRFLSKALCVSVWTIMSLTSIQHAEANAGSKKDVRMMRNDDGSISEFKRSSDDRVIERRTYANRKGGAGDRVLIMSVIYRKDKQGKLRSGKIYDGSGQLLYRVTYGYHRATGNLVAEDMFDARVKRGDTIIDPTTNQPRFKETPVRIMRHRYDAQGRQLKPLVVCKPAGKTAEELFGKEGSSHIKDPWSN